MDKETLLQVYRQAEDGLTHQELRQRLDIVGRPGMRFPREIARALRQLVHEKRIYSTSEPRGLVWRAA